MSEVAISLALSLPLPLHYRFDVSFASLSVELVLCTVIFETQPQTLK